MTNSSQFGMDGWAWPGECGWVSATGYTWPDGHRGMGMNRLEQITWRKWLSAAMWAWTGQHGTNHPGQLVWGQLSVLPRLPELPAAKHVSPRACTGARRWFIRHLPEKNFPVTLFSSSFSSSSQTGGCEDLDGEDRLLLNPNKREILAHLDLKSCQVLYLPQGRQNLTFSKSCCLHIHQASIWAFCL